MDELQRSPADAVVSPPQATLEQRLAFLQFTPADRRLLRSIAPRLKGSSDAFVESFYRHLFAFPQTARFLQDPAVVTRLKGVQQAHLQAMLEDEIDEQYVARCRRVGDVHARLGVGPQIVLGAYNQYLQYGLRELAADGQLPLGKYAECVLALLKAILLDVELMLDAYFTEATQNLRQALDMVFRTNTELRQFAQLTSHDLKTPLATVVNLCDEALDEFGAEMPPPAAKLVAAAKERTYRMSRMIDELLEVAASGGDLEANGEIDSRRVIDEVVERLAPQLAQQEIELHLPAELPTVWGNPVRLRESFYNVLSNAVKFCDKRPGRIDITVEQAGGSCTFHIRDNGPGIPSEDLERIFSPFRRLRMHQHRPGSGLGLYFTKNLIEQQGGRVWADSHLGEGSTFHLQLKRKP